MMISAGLAHDVRGIFCNRSGLCRVAMLLVVVLSIPGWAQDSETSTASDSDQSAETAPPAAGETAPLPSEEAAQQEVPEEDWQQRNADAESAPVLEDAQTDAAETPAKQSPSAPDSIKPGEREDLGIVVLEEKPEQPPPPLASTPIVLDEVVVSARKRHERAFDVPISMTTMDNKFIVEKGITDLGDLAHFVPNAKFRTDVGVGLSINIRGFTKAATNAAFDQAVGLLVDGVSYNDNEFFAMGLVDLKSIEVLRGPQGTLLGKNTTAGLLNVTTQGASDEYQGYLDIQKGDYALQRIEGAFGGPLIPGVLNFRVAAMNDVRDGLMSNTTANAPTHRLDFDPRVFHKELSRDRYMYRLRLEAPYLLGVTWGLLYEDARANYVGTGREILVISPAVANYLRQYDPNLDTTPGNYVNSINDPSSTGYGYRKAALSAKTSLGGWELDAKLGWAVAGGPTSTGDPTPAPLTFYQVETDKPQTNIDIVVTSPSWLFEGLDLTAGVFYEDRDLTTIDRTDLGVEPLVGLLAADRGNSPPPAGIPPTGTPGAPTGAEVETSELTFVQNTKNAAIYGQLAWRLSDAWQLTNGVRVSREHKAATWDRQFTSTSTALFTQVLGYEEFTDELERSETTLQPKVALNFQPGANLNFFLHWARGFRSGGFNMFATQPGEDNLTFDKEVVDEFALNTKMKLLEGTLAVNFGLFRMDLKNFQILTTEPGNLASKTDNAGQARAQGAELDWHWLATDVITLRGAIAFNDARFIEYPFGPCPQDRPNFDGDEDRRCDLSGLGLPRAPRWNGNLDLGFKVPAARVFGSLFGGFQVLGGVSLEFESDTITGFPGDDRFVQEAFARWNAHVGVGGERWSLRLLGKNLSDEVVQVASGHITATNEIVQDVDAPRTAFAQLRLKF